MLAAEQFGIAEQVQRALQNHDAGLVHAQGAHERMLPDFDNRLLASDDDAALVGANQLVGAEQNHVRARLDGFADGRFVRQPELLQVQQRARAEIVYHQQALAVRQFGQLGERHFAGEPDDAVVARMHAHERGGLSVMALR